MPDYDAGFKIVARLGGKELAAMAGILCETWKPVVGEVQAATRIADRAFLAGKSGERFLVYMEAYTRWQASAPWSILAKSGLLSERDRLPTASLLFVLLRRGYRPQGGRLRLTVRGKPTQQVWFREICLWRVKPRAAWAKSPAVLPLYPLCDHERKGRDAVTFPAVAIAEKVRDPVLRADLLTTLAIFGKLAYPGLDVLQLIGREKMRESKFFDEVMAESAILTRREDILRVAAARFGHGVRLELEEKLMLIDAGDALAELIDVAAKCKDVSELHEKLDAMIAERESGRGTRRKKISST